MKMIAIFFITYRCTLKTLLIVISLVLLSACSMFASNKPIDNINVIEQGKNQSDRKNMQKVCKGFYVSQEKFIAFYQHATIADETQINKRYKVLPCYSSGTVLFDGEKFNWIIRAGGVGEFYNENRSFTKICGIACCKKVAGVC